MKKQQFLEKTFEAILNIKDIVSDAETTKALFENLNSDNSNQINDIIESTQSIIHKLKNNINEIEKVFDENYNALKSECNELSNSRTIIDESEAETTNIVSNSVDESTVIVPETESEAETTNIVSNSVNDLEKVQKEKLICNEVKKSAQNLSSNCLEEGAESLRVEPSSSEDDKPIFIKCVDIGNLLDPAVSKKGAVEQLNDSVIILSDSDHENHNKSLRACNKNNMNKHKLNEVKRETSKPTLPPNRSKRNTSSKFSSVFQALRKTRARKLNSINIRKQLSDNSDSDVSVISDDSLKSKNNISKRKKLHKAKISDEKCYWKCYVPLPRFTCEQLIETFSSCGENKKKQRHTDRNDLKSKQTGEKRSEISDDSDCDFFQSSQLDIEAKSHSTPIQLLSKTKKVVVVPDVNNSNFDARERNEENSKNVHATEIGGKKKEKVKLLESDSEDDFDNTKNKTESKEESVITSKKRPRNLINSDSESSHSANDNSRKSSRSSSDSENEEDEEKAPVRRRIKRVRDSSSDEGEDKKTRKTIRKVLANDSLMESTKEAEKAEAERKARIAERQKKYNKIYDETTLETAIIDKIVLDFNEKTKEELIQVDGDLVKKLKPHQAKGVQFMWDACFESLERIKNTKGSGCILAHCMGLGKTLQVVALVHTLLVNEAKTGVSKVLVACPLNTVLNWVSEFNMWLADLDDKVEVYELTASKQNYDRRYYIDEWYKEGGVMVLSYDMFRNLSNPNNKRISKKLRNSFRTGLVDPGPDLVICDEGHLLKNEKTGISIAMNRLRTMRRIVLTGTPMQNNLKEYYCMLNFVKPNLLGTYKEYMNRFVNPITNGQYTDSTHFDIQIMRKRSHVLHKMLDGTVQRKDYNVLAPYLPPKCEYVLFLNLTDVQIQLYDHYLNTQAKMQTAEGSSIGRTTYLFTDFQAFQRICTHPRVLRDKSIQQKIAQDKKELEDEDESEGSLKDFIVDESSSADSDSDNSSHSSSSKKSKDNKFTKKRVTRAVAAANDIDLAVTISDDEKKDEPPEWWQQFCKGDELENIMYSTKLFLLFEILKQCEQIGDKVLLFSQSLYSLNVIEYFLAKVDEATQTGNTSRVCGFTGSWSLGLDYFRLDGSSSCDNRAAWCNIFNNPDNTRARLFLISTRAGGLGINLVAANRVIIFDVSWNPSHDLQSIYRVYRFGQTKPCYIYRFVTFGTMEMKIYERQVTKQAISKRVIDEQQIDRHYNQNDLSELYKFEPSVNEDRPIPLVPKDVLLAELLQSQEQRIYKYHEHQTLLENREDEVLNEEERKAAWDEFENEKTNRQNRGILNQLPIATIIQSLTSILRKENPLWTTTEIKNAIPMMCQQLESEIAAGNTMLYARIIEETKLLRTQYFLEQAQAMQMYQKHQQWLAQNNLQPNRHNYTGRNLNNPIPSTSANEIIELND